MSSIYRAATYNIFHNVCEKFLNEFRKFIPFKLKTIIYLPFCITFCSLAFFLVHILFAMGFFIQFFFLSSFIQNCSHEFITCVTMQFHVDIFTKNSCHSVLTHVLCYFIYYIKWLPSVYLSSLTMFFFVIAIVNVEIFQPNLPSMHLMWLFASKCLHFM